MAGHVPRHWLGMTSPPPDPTTTTTTTTVVIAEFSAASIPCGGKYPRPPPNGGLVLGGGKVGPRAREVADIFSPRLSSRQKNSAMTIVLNYCHRGILRQRNIRDPRRTAALFGAGKSRPAFAGGRGYFFATTIVASKKFRDDSNFVSHCHRGIFRRLYSLRRKISATSAERRPCFGRRESGPAFAGDRGYFFAATIVASKKFRDDSGLVLNYCHRGILRQQNIRDLRRTAAPIPPPAKYARGRIVHGRGLNPRPADEIGARQHKTKISHPTHPVAPGGSPTRKIYRLVR